VALYLLLESEDSMDSHSTLFARICYSSRTRKKQTGRQKLQTSPVGVHHTHNVSLHSMATVSSFYSSIAVLPVSYDCNVPAFVQVFCKRKTCMMMTITVVAAHSIIVDQ